MASDVVASGVGASESVVSGSGVVCSAVENMSVVVSSGEVGVNVPVGPGVPVSSGGTVRVGSSLVVSPADGVGVGCIKILTILSFLNAMLGRITLRSHKPWDMSLLGTPRHPQPYHHTCDHLRARWAQIDRYR